MIAYFQLWRPLRVITADEIVKPVCQTVISNTQSNVRIDPDAAGVYFAIQFGEQENSSTIYYRIQGGFFFLVAIISLVFVTFEVKYYLYLIGFHILSFLLILLLLIIGCGYFSNSFYLADFLISYLVPVLSMAYIPWLIYYLRKTKH
ncbi:MAG: hypothetical protein U5K69_07485 [Balneolaceae bacterium]|nr:hypothetical protein [Balneolaceae bacterium]